MTKLDTKTASGKRQWAKAQELCEVEVEVPNWLIVLNGLCEHAATFKEQEAVGMVGGPGSSTPH